MFRYIAFLWDSRDEQARSRAAALVARARETSAAWSIALHQAGLVVLAAGESPVAGVLRVNDYGVVLGRLFRGRQVAQLDKNETSNILYTSGHSLPTQYWGNYVAILFYPTTRAVHILRGPASALPCFLTSTEDGAVTLCFSWMESVAAVDARRFTINWRQLARTLVGPPQSSQTDLNEVRELLPGHCEVWCPGTQSDPPSVAHQCWNPIEIARSNPIQTFAAAAETLHDVTHASISAWAKAAPRILHMLSGGLDSSIVLGCLRDTTAEVACLTHFAEGHDSDERAFARLAVAQARCIHIERKQLTDIDLRALLYKTRMESSPGLRIPQVDRVEPDLAIEIGANAITRGHGGDELFCRHHTQYYVADFVRMHGLSRELIPLLLHSATLEGDSIWVSLVRALRDAYIPRRWNLAQIFIRDQEGESLLHPDILHSLPSEPTPSSRNCPPGKLWQIGLINGRRLHHGPFARDTDSEPIAPLLSQPIIEACLRIPTWFAMKDRRERAVARAAFRQNVPQEILERRWKGGAEHTAWKILRQNLTFVRDVLLDSRLARERVVDRRRLEVLLTGSPQSLVRSTVPVFDLLGAEAWLQAWSGRGVDF